MTEPVLSPKVTPPQTRTDIQRLRRKTATIEQVDNGYVVTLKAIGSSEEIIVELWLKRGLKDIQKFMEAL